MKGLIVTNEATGLFGSETIFIDEFLRAGRKWAPNFCDNWVQQKEAANLIPEFYDTARHYRMAVKKTLNHDRLTSSRFSANASTLQGQPQSGQKPERGNKSDGKEINRKEKELLKRDVKCVCKEKHLFRLCPYIKTSARPIGWKESKPLRNEIRSKVQKNIRYFVTIKKMTDTNILDGIFEDDRERRSERSEEEA